MTPTPPRTPEVASVVDGPTRDGSELRWRVRLTRGGEGVLSQLLPELARDEATRRRYVRDVARIRDVAAAAGGAIADVVAIGEGWRLRAVPEGVRLEDWLRGAPVPWEDAVARVVAIATALHDVHAAGAVLRDLHPRHVVLGARAVFTDVGLARTDILSSRTAASLVLEGSPYAAPEHASRTVVDARADLFTLGVIAWRALTGTLPYGDGPAFLADGRALPSLAALRPDVPPWIVGAVEKCLAWTPGTRPTSATEALALLRAETGLAPAVVRTTCQACHATLRDGLRLCLACGRVPVVFTPAGDLDATRVDLTEASDDAAFVPGLKAILDGVTLQPIGKLQFLIGDGRLYSKREREARRKLPLTLVVTGQGSAAELERRIKLLGGKVRVRGVQATATSRARARQVMLASGTAVAASVIALFATGLAAWAGVTLGVAALAFLVAAIYRAAIKAPSPALVQLRPLPALVPATDALTQRLADAARGVTADDARDAIADVALSVQGLLDLRTGDALTLVLPTADRLVTQACIELRALTAADVALATLDEGTLVRALAASEARREPASARADLLDALDRLRTLEDDRTRRLGRLLECATLLRRALAIALADPARVDAAELAVALAALD